MARKKKHEEHENLERWLISYADFITLLFAFFVVMYSISQVNIGKFKVLSEALIQAFASNPRTPSPIQVGELVKSTEEYTQATDPKAIFEKEPKALVVPPTIKSTLRKASKSRAELKEMADDIEKAMAPLIKADLLTVRRHAFWMEVEINTSILFASGVAELEGHAIPVLREIAAILAKFPQNPIQVEGFTDNVPIKSVAYPSNWELSAARAASVVHLFSKVGIRPGRMAAIGFGEFRPNADNKTSEGRTKNRRVVLVVLAEGAAPHFFGSADPSAQDMEAISTEVDAAEAGNPPAEAGGGP